MKSANKTKIICVSGIVIAIYVVIMHVTHAFAFGAYQIRIATCLYSLSYLFPFLVLPLGISNFLGNFIGGLGFIDVIGGTFVGIITSGGVYFVRRFRLPTVLVIPIIILGPGLIVPIWLSQIIGFPYLVLVLNLCIGQTLPAFLGYVLIKTLSRLELDRL